MKDEELRGRLKAIDTKVKEIDRKVDEDDEMGCLVSVLAVIILILVAIMFVRGCF